MSSGQEWRRKKYPSGKVGTYQIPTGDKANLPTGLMPVSPTSVGSQSKANVSRANAKEIQLRNKHGVFAEIAFGATTAEPASWQKNRNVRKVAVLLERFDELQGRDSVPDVLTRANIELQLKARYPEQYQEYLKRRSDQDGSW